MSFAALLACLMLLHGVRASAQPADIMPAPSPPILALRPPVPLLSTPPPQQSNATGNPLLITLYGLDLWSLLASWDSGIQALLEEQLSPSLSLLGLSAPGMCASQLLALNTTALLNTSLTAQELMPGLGYLATDVAQLLRDYLRDSSIAVQVQDFCAGNRTAASFIANGTLVNATWPTLRVAINLVTTDPESAPPPPPSPPLPPANSQLLTPPPTTLVAVRHSQRPLMWSAACGAKHGTCHNPSTRPLLLGSKLPAVGDPSPRAALPMA
ncbi:hypothetical protein V8C86DRAFT_2439168 [Haematococcus lacustris]